MTPNKTYYFADKREHSILTFVLDGRLEVAKERGDAVLYRVENDDAPLANLSRARFGKSVVAIRGVPTTTRFGTSIAVEVVSAFESRALDKVLKKERATSSGSSRKWKLSVRDETEIDYLLDAIFDVYAKEIGVSETDGLKSIFFAG